MAQEASYAWPLHQRGTLLAYFISASKYRTLVTSYLARLSAPWLIWPQKGGAMCQIGEFRKNKLSLPNSTLPLFPW